MDHHPVTSLYGRHLHLPRPATWSLLEAAGGGDSPYWEEVAERVLDYLESHSEFAVSDRLLNRQPILARLVHLISINDAAHWQYTKNHVSRIALINTLHKETGR